MQCGVKRKHCPSLEHINIERQQQSLFDLSIFKLQQEQLRHGVEPRLLRFVLINNALRALQGHMFLFGDDDDFSFDSSERCASPANNGGGGATESFLSNTFRDGGLPTTPASPPTPVKVIKLETTLSDQSPLVASTPFQSVVADSACATGGGGGGEEREGVECASLPPCERLENIVSCVTTREGRESATATTVHEALSTTMTTVEERPADLSTTSIADDDSPCACRRASLGKRKREEAEKGEEFATSNARLCQCNDSKAEEDESIESVRDGVKEDSIEKDCICSVSKKICSRPNALLINGAKRINGLNGLNSVYTVLGLDQLAPPTSCSPSSSPSPAGSPEEPDEELSTTPSPIDFTKVDPSLYDYDDKAPLFITAQDPPTATPPDSNGHIDSVRDDHSGGVGDSVSPDSSSTAPLSPSLSCSSAISQSAAPSSSVDDATPSSSEESVTSPTLAITATSTTFSLPSCSEFPLISSSNHNRSVSQACATSAIDSDLVIGAGGPDGSKHCCLPPSSSSSCSLEGLVSAQNGSLVHDDDSGRTENEGSISNGLNGGVPSSPEGAENDFLEDIVSLLMT